MKEWKKEYAWLSYDDENNSIYFARRGHGVGTMPVRLESGERMRSRPELTTLGMICCGPITSVKPIDARLVVLDFCIIGLKQD